MLTTRGDAGFREAATSTAAIEGPILTTMADERMPSLSEWLAEYRSRRPATEVALYRGTLPESLISEVSRQRVTAVRISRSDDPDNPNPDKGFYLFSLDENGNELADTWHETVDDAFAQAEYQFGLNPADWTAVGGEDQ